MSEREGEKGGGREARAGKGGEGERRRGEARTERQM